MPCSPPRAIFPSRSRRGRFGSSPGCRRSRWPRWPPTSRALAGGNGCWAGKCWRSCPSRRSRFICAPASRWSATPAGSRSGSRQTTTAPPTSTRSPGGSKTACSDWRLWAVPERAQPPSTHRPSSRLRPEACRRGGRAGEFGSVVTVRYSYVSSVAGQNLPTAPKATSRSGCGSRCNTRRREPVESGAEGPRPDDRVTAVSRWPAALPNATNAPDRRDQGHRSVKGGDRARRSRYVDHK